MATKDQIKKAILDIAGNPESGPIASLADAWAEAIVGLDSTVPSKESASSDKPAKETRILKAEEKR
jgi:hypothetical protein